MKSLSLNIVYNSIICSSQTETQHLSTAHMQKNNAFFMVQMEIIVNLKNKDKHYSQKIIKQVVL